MLRNLRSPILAQAVIPNIVWPWLPSAHIQLSESRDAHVVGGGSALAGKARW